jgi:hypothetical protein
MPTYFADQIDFLNSQLPLFFLLEITAPRASSRSVDGWQISNAVSSA